MFLHCFLWLLSFFTQLVASFLWLNWIWIKCGTQLQDTQTTLIAKLLRALFKDQFRQTNSHLIYRKIPKISPSMYKPLQIKAPHTGNAKNPSLNRPSKYKPPPGACTFEIALKYKVKQSKNGKFTSNYKASSINFDTPISLRRKAPPNISPSKNKPLKESLWKI